MTFKPSHLHAHLGGLGAKAQKKSSQNFLIDGNILKKIVSTAGVASGDVVLEIGAGAGALTGALLDKGVRLLAVEKDPLLAKGLHQISATAPSSLIIIEGDFLQLHVEELLQEHLQGGRRCHVVANLPYHITSPILGKILPLCELIDSVTIMVQKEVGKRITAKPGSSDYGRLSLFCSFYSHPSYCFTVSPNCFFPKPKVDSCIVRLVLKKPQNIASAERLFLLIRTAFGQRRKMVRSTLSTLYESQRIEEALKKLSLPVTCRPEELSLEQFIALFEQLDSCEE